MESDFSFTSKDDDFVSLRDGLVSVREESGPGVGGVGVVAGGGVLDSGCLESCVGWLGCFWLENKLKIMNILISEDFIITFSQKLQLFRSYFEIIAVVSMQLH